MRLKKIEAEEAHHQSLRTFEDKNTNLSVNNKRYQIKDKKVSSIFK